MSRRRSNVRQYSAEDQALTAISKEAESRQAAKRAARTEAREIRMREIERQQREVEEREKQGGGSSDGPGRTRQSAATGSRRGSDDSSEGGGGDSVASDRNLKMELRALEEKYKTAMMNSAQLDNEKQSLVYSLELLKDQLEEQSEAHTELQREYKDKHRELELTKRELAAVKLELKGLREQNDYKDRLIAESGLVIVAAENGDLTLERSNEAPSANGPIGTGGLLLSSEALDLLNKGREGSLGTHSLANSPSSFHTTHPAPSTSTLPPPPSQPGSDDPHCQSEAQDTKAMGRDTDDLDGSSVDGPMVRPGLAGEGGMGSGVDAVDALSVKSDGSSHSPDGKPSENCPNTREADTHSGPVGEAQGGESTLVGMLTFSHDDVNSCCKGEGQERSDETKGNGQIIGNDADLSVNKSDLPSVIITECSHSHRVSSVDSEEEHDEFFDAVSTPLPSSKAEFSQLVDDVTAEATCTDGAIGEVGSGSEGNKSVEETKIDAEEGVKIATEVGQEEEEEEINRDEDEEVVGNVDTIKTEEQEPHKEEQMSRDSAGESVVTSESEEYREDEKEQINEDKDRGVEGGDVDNVKTDERKILVEEISGTAEEDSVIDTDKKEEDILVGEEGERGVEIIIADSSEGKDMGEQTHASGVSSDTEETVEQDATVLLAQSSENIKDTSLGDGASVSAITESESFSFEKGDENSDSLGDKVTDESMDENVSERDSNVVVADESCDNEGQHLKTQNDNSTSITQNVHASAVDGEIQVEQKDIELDKPVEEESVDKDKGKAATELEPQESSEQSQADSVQDSPTEEQKMGKTEDAENTLPDVKKDEDSTELSDTLPHLSEKTKKLDHNLSEGEVAEDSEACLDEDEYDFDDIGEVLDDCNSQLSKEKGKEPNPEDREGDLKDTASIGSKDSGLQEGMSNKESEAYKADTASFGSRDSGLQESVHSKENEGSREDAASAQSGDSVAGGNDSLAETKGEVLEAAGSNEPLDLEAKLDQLASHGESATMTPSAKDKHPHKKSSKFKKFKNIFHK